jgi:hypothetical protein
MAATINLIVWRSTNAATKAGSATELSFLTADTAGDPELEDSACRINNPITIPAAACAYSYTKHISACINVAPANSVGNFQIWGTYPAATPPAGTCVLYGTEASGAGTTPHVTLNSVGTAALNSATSGAKAAWDAASYAAATCSTQYLVLQLQVANSACVGNWGGANGCALSYSYDEV